MGNIVSRPIVCMRLHRIFGLDEETYLTTVKLLYIYDWIEPIAGDASLDVIIYLRKSFKRESNLCTIDALYGELRTIAMNHSGRYNTTTLRPPEEQTVYYLGHRV
jgi:hypothetical protein